MANAADIYAVRARFPEFAGVKDADIAAVLNTADVYLDADLWSARDFPTARLYWVAHMLTLQQEQAANATVDGTGLSDLFMRSISIGERTVSFGQRRAFDKSGSGGAPGEVFLSYTYYGQLFLQLRSRNIFPIAIV